MFTRLSTVEVLDGVIQQIDETLIPELKGPHAVVIAQICSDLLASVQRRIANEPQWIAEEVDTMLDLLARARPLLREASIPEAKHALAAIAKVEQAVEPAPHDRVSIDYLYRRYSEVGAALEDSIRVFGLTADEAPFADLVSEVQRYLVTRSDRELVIAGNQPLRGRG